MGWEIFGSAVVAVVVGLIGWRRWYLYKNRFIGTGGYFRKDDDGWYVSTRLLESPLGRAKIPIGARLISVNGVKVQDKTLKEFGTLIRPEKGKKISYGFLRSDGGEHVVELVFEIIQGPIPEYRHSYIESHRLTRGMMYCMKTGQFVPSQRLTDGAITAALR